MTRKTLFIAVAALLIAAFAGAVFFYRADEQPIAARDVLERDDAPIKGNKDAKVTIVEFLDPACGTCRQFHPIMQKLVEQHDGKVRVMVRYAPLHPGTDQVVLMAEAARKQGLFWQALETLFQRQNEWVVQHKAEPVRVLTILRSIGLDLDRLSRDMQSDEVKAAVDEDLKDGQTLGVRATPEFFVNGRPLPEFGLQPLLDLVDEAVAEAY